MPNWPGSIRTSGAASAERRRQKNRPPLSGLPRDKSLWRHSSATTKSHRIGCRSALPLPATTSYSTTHAAPEPPRSCRVNDIYQGSRLKQRALRQSGDQTLIPDVIANTQAQLDVARKQYIQGFHPEDLGKFLDVSNPQNFTGAADVLNDIAKKRANAGSQDFSDLGPGADAGDADATRQASEAIQKIAGYAEDLPRILDGLNQLLEKVNVN